MNFQPESDIPSTATIHAVSLPPESTIPVLDAAEVSGFGFRQYPTVDSLLESAAPSSQGCVLLVAEGEGHSLASISRIQSHFYTLPVIVLMESNSAENAVDLMRQGVFSVLTRPFEHQKLVSTMTNAVESSVSNQATIDSCREASLRMAEATEKELEVLVLIMEGKKNKEIAGILGITVRAVEDRRFRLMKKVGVESVAELVALAVTARYYDQGFTAGNLRNSNLSEARQCVKGIEVWTPAEDESVLQLSQSCYRDAAAFQEATKGVTFRRGEGLPGAVWERRAPAFLDEIITSDFVRSGAAGAVGMTTAVGFPVFSKERVQAVILILLDSRHQMKAAFESWRVDPATDALRLVNGTYINCEKLRRLSEFVHLPVGQGLAGVAAEQARPYVGSRFADDGNAVRGLALASEQLLSGVSLPLTDSGSVTSDVFQLFNSEANPVFSMLQLWKVTPSGLQLAAENVDGVPSLTAQMSKAMPAADSIAYECLMTGLPIVADNGTAHRIVHSPSTAPPSFGIAIPTVVSGKVVAVSVLAN
ncbi:MAG: LuxR C-terminal-related transcriptional regulator [Planctomycetaceae bacterium]|nr:LuxR C-terminal-related transcriptional regulator [Planctomycetaceae bacterium]